MQSLDKMQDLYLIAFGREALRSLCRNKLRSGLSVLGITIGIAAVVCVVTIGTTGAQVVEWQLQNLGDNMLWIEAGSRNVNGVATGGKGMRSLTSADAEAIRRLPSIKSLSPHANGIGLVVAGERNWNTRYHGVTPEFLEIRRWEVTEGECFTDRDVACAANVCLLGQTVRKEIFGAEEAVGRTVRLNTKPFRVAGVLAAKGQSGIGEDQDDMMIVPYMTVIKKMRARGNLWLDGIVCSAYSPEDRQLAIEQISALLRERHHIPSGREDDFNIRHPEEVIKAQLAARRTLSLLLTCIASIALLVGGIGIMNVMLVTVAERSKEIGLRLAIGATTRVIWIQFLEEAVLLSLIGGILGVLIGIAASFAIEDSLNWPASISPQALIIAPFFAALVGICSGCYPAWKATRLNPVTALIQE